MPSVSKGKGFAVTKATWILVTLGVLSLAFHYYYTFIAIDPAGNYVDYIGLDLVPFLLIFLVAKYRQKRNAHLTIGYAALALLYGIQLSLRTLEYFAPFPMEITLYALRVVLPSALLILVAVYVNRRS